MEKLSHYHQYKAANVKWQKDNREYLNEYYRKYNAKRRAEKKLEEHRKIALEYIQNQLNNNVR